MLAAAVGCTHPDKMPEDKGLPQPNPSRQSLFQQTNLFGGQKTTNVPGMPMPVAVAPPDDGSKTLKPETFAAFADADVASAFAEDRTAIDRDALLDRARQRYKAALEQDPDNKAAHIGMSRMYAKSGDKDRAAETLQQAMRRHPDDHDLAHRLAATYIQFADWPAAIVACKKALAGDPENRTYKKTLGYCEAVNGQWEDAFGTMLDVLPEAEARYFLGRVLGDLQKPEEAKQQMELALQADPQFAPAKVYLAKQNNPQASAEQPKIEADQEASTP